MALAYSSSATAQSAYVGASAIADVVRLSGSTVDTFGNGEAIGAALRAGTGLGAQWGVDIEFARSGEIETTPDVRILTPLLAGEFPNTLLPTIFPPPEISTRQRLSTLATTAWWRQDVGGRFGLVYMGGVAFTRTVREISVQFPRVPLPAPLGGVIAVPSIEQESVGYDAGVIVGLDGRVRMTDHLHLVPGVRLQSIPDGWVVRPGVGVSWEF
jgi:hypothetical protein